MDLRPSLTLLLALLLFSCSDDGEVVCYSTFERDQWQGKVSESCDDATFRAWEIDPETGLSPAWVERLENGYVAEIFLPGPGINEYQWIVRDTTCDRAGFQAVVTLGGPVLRVTHWLVNSDCEYTMRRLYSFQRDDALGLSAIHLSVGEEDVTIPRGSASEIALAGTLSRFQWHSDDVGGRTNVTEWIELDSGGTVRLDHPPRNL